MGWLNLSVVPKGLAECGSFHCLQVLPALKIHNSLLRAGKEADFPVNQKFTKTN